MTDHNLFTVAEFAAYAPEVDMSRFTPDTISGMISSASRKVTDYLEYSPIAEDIVGEIANASITSEGDLLIFPKKLPIQTLASVSLTKGTTSIGLNLVANGVNRYNIDFNQRTVRIPYYEVSITGPIVFTNFFQLRNNQFYTNITYRGGWEPSDLPATIKEAAMLYMRDQSMLQFNPMGAIGLRQGAVQFQFGARGKNGKSAYVNQAELLLGPYRRIG